MYRLAIFCLALILSNAALAGGQGKGHDAGKGKPGHGQFGCETSKQASKGKTRNPHCSDNEPFDLSCSTAVLDDGLVLLEIFNAGPGDAFNVDVSNVDGDLLGTIPVVHAIEAVELPVPGSSAYTVLSSQFEENIENNTCLVDILPS